MMEFPEIQNPFPGLRPFELDESNLFFGREGQSDELLARLQRKRFLAVVGTSGSGKSSLVRAGLLPALYGGLMGGAGSSWRIAILRPGHDPIGNLAGALDEQELVPKSIPKDLQAFDMILDHDISVGPALKLETKASPRPEELSMESEAPEVGVVSASKPDPLFQHAIIETTLRRSTVGLADVVRQARMSAHENLLIVVDQFEELFRFKEARKETGSEDDAAAFVKLLIEASAQDEVPIYVVLTMRSDFLGDCSQFTGLPEAINQGQYLIPRMSRDERRAAITGPVAVGGGEITLPLVSRLLNDVGDNPDQLPILQHALMRTWDFCEAHRRNGEAIGLDHYEAIGTMSEALSRHADEAFDELRDDRSRVIAERLFKRLTERGADNRETRRPTRLAEICAVAEATEDEVVTVIDVFRYEGRSFLMPPAGGALNGETVIDISHESLIRNWKRLQSWVDEEGQSSRTYRRLAEDALLHRENKAGLLDDPGLQLTLDWRDEQSPTDAWAARYHNQSDVESAFPNAESQDEANLRLFDAAMFYLNASRDARDAAVAERERLRNAELEGERRERMQAERYAAGAKRFAEEQAKSARRLRWLAAGMAVMFLVALGGAAYAIKAGTKAERARRESEESLKKLQTTQSALEQKTVLAEEKTKLAEEKTKLAEANEIAAKAASERAQIEAERAKAEKLAGDRARMGEQQALKEALVEKKRADERAKQAEDALTAKKTAEEAAAKSAGKDKLNKEALEALQRYEFNKASAMFRKLAEQAEADSDPISEGRAKSNLGAVYLKQGRYSEAEKEYKDAHDQLRAKLGGGRQLAATMIGLAQVYRESRKYPQAEKQYNDLMGAAILDSPNDAADYLPLVAEVSANKGDIYREQGKFVDALKSYDKAVETWMQIQSDSLSLADRFRGIAQFYLEQERYDTAEKLYLRAYEIWRKYLAEGNLAFARDIEEVGSMYRARKKYDEAEKYYVEARKAWEQQALSGTERANRYRDLAQFYLEWGKTAPRARAESESLKVRADEILKTALDTVAPIASNSAAADAIETLLPESGVGYVTNNRGAYGEFQYGRAATIRAIITLGTEWKRQHPLVPFSVGQISRKGGGRLPPLLTHRLGIEFDLRPLRKDGLNQPTTIDDPYYSSSLTKELVQLVKQMYPDAIIFFNDPATVEAKLTRRFTGYDNHLHIRIAKANTTDSAFLPGGER